jgi:hypothetical protein
MLRREPSILALIVTALVCPLVNATQDAELISAAATGHSQARLSIVSIHAQMRNITLMRGKNGTRGRILRNCEWWQLGSDVKWKVFTLNERLRPGPPHTPSTQADPTTWPQCDTCAINAGRLTMFGSKTTSQGVRIRGASLATARDGDTGFTDLWSRAGFLVQEKPRVSLLDVLKDHRSVRHIAYEGARGTEKTLHMVGTLANDLNVEAWLSPRHNFQMTRMITWYGKDPRASARLEYVTHAFCEPQPGIFFPQHSTLRSYGPGDPAEAPRIITDTFFDDVTVNIPLDRGALELIVPEGTPTFDLDNQITYTMGKAGQPSAQSPVRPLSDRLIRMGGDGPPTGTTVRPARWYRAGAIAMCVAAVAVVWTVRRRLVALLLTSGR